MKWFVIYDETTGEQVSESSGSGAAGNGTKPVGWENPPGLAYKPVGTKRPDARTQKWNSTTLVLDPFTEPKSRRQVLADKAIWGQNDRDEALRIFLDPRKGV